jgi:hypothetical protein
VQGALKGIVGFNGEVNAWIGERTYGEAVREYADTITASESGALALIRAAIMSAANAPGVPSKESESLKRRAAQAFKDLSREQQQQQEDEDEDENEDENDE